MKALKIPYSRHFKGVVGINDAVVLYGKLREMSRRSLFVRSEEEEFEDDEGNVMNKRTYEDLLREGII